MSTHNPTTHPPPSNIVITIICTTMSHTETVTFTNCRTYTGRKKNHKIKKKSQRITNASVIHNFRTFICSPHFDCEMCFPEVRTVGGETKLCPFLCHAHPCVVLTHHLTLPPDTLHHLCNRYSTRCTCQEQFLPRQLRGEEQSGCGQMHHMILQRRVTAVVSSRHHYFGHCSLCEFYGTIR